MANNAYVSAAKGIVMGPDEIIDALEKLNQERFGGNLDIEHGQGWWELWYISPINKKEYVYRSCMLMSRGRRFSIKHGGGGDFGWWIDFHVTNAIALRFDGIIRDEGVSEHWKGEPDYYPSFVDFQLMMLRGGDKSGPLNQIQTNLLIEYGLQLLPPEVRESVLEACRAG